MDEKTHKEIGEAFYQIQRSVHELRHYLIGRFNIEPNTVYLGHEEYMVIMSHTKHMSHTYFKTKEDGKSILYFMGLEVERVIKDSHLDVSRVEGRTWYAE